MPRMIANASRMAATERDTPLGDDGEAKVIKKFMDMAQKYCLLKIHVNNKIFHSQPFCLKIFYRWPLERFTIFC